MGIPRTPGAPASRRHAARRPAVLVWLALAVALGETDALVSVPQPLEPQAASTATAPTDTLTVRVRTGRKIDWDPAKQQIIGDAEASKRATYQYRSPWRLSA